LTTRVSSEIHTERNRSAGRGESAKLGELTAGAEWMTHITRAGLHLEGSDAVVGATGEAAMEREKL
jgi:hypothetical protein